MLFVYALQGITPRRRQTFHQLHNRDANDLDILFRLLFVDPSVLNPVDNIQPLNCSTKNSMLPVQPGRFFRRDEELATIGVWARICHADCVWLIVLQTRKFIVKLLAPDRLAACTVAKRITGLNHKFADYAVKYDVVVVIVFSMCDEILNGLWCGIWKETNVNIAICGVNYCRIAGLYLLGLVFLLGC